MVSEIKEKLFKITDTPFFVILSFAFLLFLRLYQLHADISPLKNLNDLVDEGLWVHNAMNMALFGKWTIDQFNQPLIGAPLFNYLLYISFKIFGTGFFQARLIPALSGWLTLIVVYFLVRQSRSRSTSLACAGLLGFMNEFLMYNKVCFPESLQILFFCLMFLSWLLGRRIKAFHVLAGLCFSLAYLTKMSAIYFIPVILLLWAVEWYLEELKIGNVVLFIAGACLVLPWYIPFYLQNIDKFRFLSETIGMANLGGRINVLKDIIYFPHTYFFGYPSLIILICLFIFYFLDFMINAARGLKNAFKKLSFVELISLVWLIGGAIPLALGPDHSGRRYIMFIVPLSTLAILALSNAKVISSNISQFLQDDRSNIKTGSFMFAVFMAALTIHLFVEAASASLSLFVSLATLLAIMVLIFNKAVFTRRSLTILFTAYLFYSFVQLTGDFLTLSLLIIALYSLFMGIAIKRKWLDIHAGPLSYLIFFWTAMAIFPLLHLAAVNLQESALLIDDAFVRPLFIAGSIFLLYLNYMAFLEKKTAFVFKTFIVLLVTVNVAINGLWLLHPSFSMYDMSKYIDNASKKGDIIIGSYAMLSAVGNGTFPLWWIPNIKYDENLSKINRDSGLIYKARYLIITDELYKAGADPKKAGPSIKDVSMILKKKPVYIKHFDVIPCQFSNNKWVGLNLLELIDKR